MVLPATLLGIGGEYGSSRAGYAGEVPFGQAVGSRDLLGGLAEGWLPEGEYGV